MTFKEAGRSYQKLAQQLQAGKISQAQFTEAVNALRVQDEHGRWWQLNPADGQWLFWDGQAWIKPRTPQKQAQPKAEKPKPKPKTKSPATPRRKAATPAKRVKAPTPQVKPDMAQNFIKESRQTPLVKRSSRWWDIVSILGGVLGAFIWTLYAGVRASYEGRDWLTPILMILIPAVLVIFREPIDRFLLPIQPVRRRIPRLILFGAGIAAPFVVSWWLYQRWYWMVEYRYLHWSLVLGTFTSYVITRTPKVAPDKKGGRAGNIAILLLISFPLFWGFAGTAYADDCFRDPLNANDCLRTGGAAQIIAGLAATMTAVLVNGAEIIKTLVEIREGGTTRKDTPETEKQSGSEPPKKDKESQADSGKPPPETQAGSTERPPPDGDKTAVVQKPGAETQQSSSGDTQQASSPSKPEPQQATMVKPGPAQVAQPPAEPPKSWFDTTKMIIDYVNKIKGVADPTLIKNAEDAIRISRRMWDVFQNKASADKYIQAIRNRMSIDKWGNRLQKAGYIADAIDAVIKAGGVIQKRGYQGWEKAGAYYVEGVNKVLVTMLTKNPVVAIADQVIGDLTGHNIESTIRAGEEAWHNVTQEYANNIYNVNAYDAQIQTQDNFLRYVRKLKKMTADGQITHDEARRRARRVFDRMNK